MVKLPVALIGILCSGLLGFWGARISCESEKEPDKATTLALRPGGAPDETKRPSGPWKPRGAREPGQALKQHEELLAYAQPGSTDALALLREHAEARFAVRGGSVTFHTESLLREMMHEDPERALEFLDGIEDRDVQDRMSSLMLFGPPREHLPLFVEWMRGQQDPNYRAKLLSLFAWTWARLDSKAVFEAINTITPEEERSGLRLGVMRHLSLSERVAVLPSFPEEDRATYFASESESLAAKVPEFLYQSLAGMKSSELRSQAVTNVLRSWATRDPFRAVAEIKKTNDLLLEVEGFREVAYGWSSVDSHRASEWVDDLDPGPSRNAASAGLAEELSGEQPDMAFQWAASITDPELRLHTLEQVLGAWRTSDPTEAEAALAGSDLSESDRRSLAPSLPNKPSNP